MNYVQSLIDRQLGNYTRLSYDSILKRLVVREQESFYALQSVEAEAEPRDHDPPIFACRFAECPGYEHILALANEDGRVAIQDTSKLDGAGRLEGFQCHNNAVFDLAWMPSHMNFVTVSGDHTACLWDVDDGTPKRVVSFSSHTKSVKTAVFRPHEPSVFATGARDGHVLVWDVRTPRHPAGIILKPDNCLMNCHSSFTPKTPGSHSKRPRIDNQRAISITGLVFQDDMTLLSCGECDGNIKVWDLRKSYSTFTGEPLPKHSIPYCGSSTKNGYTNLIIDDARIRLYASCMDDVIYCFNISTYNALPEQRYIGHENRTFYIKTGLSPDCMYLVSGSSDKNAYIWNVKYSVPVARLTGHWAEVTCAAWRRGGARAGAGDAVVTCSDDARHKIWRVGAEEVAGDAGEYRGRAEAVPRADLPRWGADTPHSLKRRANTPTSYRKRARTSDRDSNRPRTKRCLTDLMNAAREKDDTIPEKRVKIDEESSSELIRAGTKRRQDRDIFDTPCKKTCTETDFKYISLPGSSFMSPTKLYEKKQCKVLSPRSPETENQPPVKTVRVLFSPPTRDLPDFVTSGEAPHLRLMSPAKKRRPDWLTMMVLDRKRDPDAKRDPEPTPKEILPRRPSVTEKTPKSKKNRTLLKYFSVSNKTKQNKK